MSQKFCNIFCILIHGAYIPRSKQFKLCYVPVVVGSVVVVGVLTRCALLHYVCNLKTAQITVQRGLILKLMLSGFELGYNALEAIKTIRCMKGTGAFDLS